MFTGALAAALEFRHNYIGTEHLLLGLVRTEGLANEILAAAGLDAAVLTPKITDKLAGFQAPAPAKKSTPRKRTAKKAQPKR